VFGNIEVHVRLPGETAREARRRQQRGHRTPKQG